MKIFGKNNWKTFPQIISLCNYFTKDLIFIIKSESFGFHITGEHNKCLFESNLIKLEDDSFVIECIFSGKNIKWWNKEKIDIVFSNVNNSDMMLELLEYSILIKSSVHNNSNKIIAACNLMFELFENPKIWYVLSFDDKNICCLSPLTDNNPTQYLNYEENLVNFKLPKILYNGTKTQCLDYIKKNNLKKLEKV